MPLWPQATQWPNCQTYPLIVLNHKSKGKQGGRRIIQFLNWGLSLDCRLRSSSLGFHWRRQRDLFLSPISPEHVVDSPTLEGILQKVYNTAGRSREAQLGHCTCVPGNRELQPNSAFVIGRCCAPTHRHSHKHRPSYMSHISRLYWLLQGQERNWCCRTNELLNFPAGCEELVKGVRS